MLAGQKHTYVCLPDDDDAPIPTKKRPFLSKIPFPSTFTT